MANRGEIARRVFRTCRDLGIGTVAVYSDADADSPHAREADRAVRLPGRRAGRHLPAGRPADRRRAHRRRRRRPPRLRLPVGERRVRAGGARRRADLDRPAARPRSPRWAPRSRPRSSWPPPGVPVLPELDPAAVAEADLPVLVKAAAGGGGRGMRVVRDPRRTARRGRRGPRRGGVARSATRRCSASRYVEAGRHLEVQVLADAHGTVWSLGERECSIQRRHQKVVEETPSPMVDDALRAELSARGRGRGEGDRLRRRRHGGVPASRRRRHASGSWRSTPGCRSSTRSPSASPAWTWSPSSCGSPRASGCRAAPPEPHGAAIEARLYAEDPAARLAPAPAARSAASPSPACGREFDVLARPGIRLDAGRRRRQLGRHVTTTRCWPR